MAVSSSGWRTHRRSWRHYRGLLKPKNIRRWAIGALIARYGQLASRRKPELVDADSYALASGEWARVLRGWNALATTAHRQQAAIAPFLRHPARRKPTAQHDALGFERHQQL